MSKIRILPEILANKIAAGEVVERPASVVKELVENALDAQSSRILIDIEHGGRSLVRVADNGHGMGQDDALLALERFATSKIHNDQDLFAIQTLGFRGEALPSIAAVSKMTLISRPESADSGVEIQIDGGKILRVSEAGAPQGTMISVARLFFNTPARRKFLKTVNTEMGHIADTVAGLALGHPEVHFNLTHNGKRIRQWPRTSDPAQRAASVLGQTAPQEMIGVQADHGELAIHGYLAPARQARKTSRGIYLYVNGRRVRDRVIQHALFEGYTGRLMKGQFPLAVLFVQLPFDRVDVNVHPTKHEIRFADPQRIHQAVQSQVAAALANAERKLWNIDTAPNPADSVAGDADADYRPAHRIPLPQKDSRPFEYQHTDETKNKQNQVVISGIRSSVSPLASLTGMMDKPAQPAKGPTGQLAQPVHQGSLWSEGGFAELSVIGQFHGTYVICQSERSLILIDQHAAHERIVYETLSRQSGRIDAQQLLIPETVELGYAEAQLLEQLVPQLNDMGLELEPFGGNTFVIKTIPVLIDDRDVVSVVVEIADRASHIGTAAGLDKILDECRMVMACHNAVRAHQRLSQDQIKHMLMQLDRCENPSHCPHGRPTWTQYTLRDLEKMFKRIVS